MNQPSEDAPARYQLRLTEAAEANIDAIMLRLARRSPEAAEQWRLGLLAAFESLRQLPYRCPLAVEDGRFHNRIRVLLYPRGRSSYRILFTVFEPVDDESGLVSVLRIIHGAQDHST